MPRAKQVRKTTPTKAPPKYANLLNFEDDINEETKVEFKAPAKKAKSPSKKVSP